VTQAGTLLLTGGPWGLQAPATLSQCTCILGEDRQHQPPSLFIHPVPSAISVPLLICIPDRRTGRVHSATLDPIYALVNRTTSRRSRKNCSYLSVTDAAFKPSSTFPVHPRAAVHRPPLVDVLQVMVSADIHVKALLISLLCAFCY
jgi:hypothetical protein